MGINHGSAGRWITTFATDVLPGDKIRRNGVERHVVTRDYTPSIQPTFRIEYGAGGENIGKLTIVAIWDPDGSVSQRVMDLSAAAIQ